jgi:hypothetical protein
MKTIAMAFLLAAALLNANAYAGPRQQKLQRQQQQIQRALRPNAAQRRSLVEDAVLGFYVNQFQQDGEVSPEVFAKILPFLQQFVQDRFEISQRRVRALNQLRQAIARNSGEDELKRLVRELDSADSEYQANQQKFFNNVDPLLNARQQAKVRIMQNMTDNRIRQMLDALQNPNAQQRRSAAPNQNQD